MSVLYSQIYITSEAGADRYGMHELVVWKTDLWRVIVVVEGRSYR